MRERRHKKRPIDDPDYGGYISVTCLSCGRPEIGSAITFKRDRHNAILCNACHCHCKVFTFSSVLVECPICDNLFETTNPSRKFCGEECREVNKGIRKAATSIKNSKKRRRAVKGIYDFING
jgi:hypothetical protein